VLFYLQLIRAKNSAKCKPGCFPWQAATPTGESYLSHVSKDWILGVVSDAVSPQVAQTLTDFKKAELVEAAEKRLFGLRWLPDNLKSGQE
jgi:hypothetical protein